MLLLELDPTHACNIAPDDAHWSMDQMWRHPGKDGIYNTNIPGGFRHAVPAYGYRLSQCDDECEEQYAAER